MFCPVKENPYEVSCYGWWSCIVQSLCVYLRSVSSLWGSELVIGTVWGGECGVGDGLVLGCVFVGMKILRGAVACERFTSPQ